MSRRAGVVAGMMAAVGLSGVPLPACGADASPCRVVVVDGETGWPVPLVELRTTHDVAVVTDNAGVAVIDQPELLGREVWFHVASPGYAVEPDGFGYRGVRLTPKVGAELRVEVRRTAIARRLGRLTGAGLLAESQKLGVGVAATESGVFGCDSIQLAEHRGRLFWLWGDTKLAKYPLGVFDCTAATTPLRPGAQWEPPISLPLDYFVDDQGTPRGVADIPGEGPTWISALVSLPDAEGAPRLAGVYSKIRNLLEAYEVGLCLWDEEREMFVRERVLWTKSEEHPEPPLHPDGHVVKWKDESGRTWLLAGNPLPKFRCRATLEAWRDPDRWEPLNSQPELSAAADGAAVRPHSGSVAWNAYRGRWITVFMQYLGSPSAFGELWYSEADQPTGPWGSAVKVLSHDNYTFYNPRLHPELTDADSPLVLFEGTYTAMFADRPVPTPRYDYNQVLYGLDLDDPALAPAQVRLP